jgi:acetylornithine deacetylase/succinyl-diaminopimelate desuccinylase-like protein
MKAAVHRKDKEKAGSNWPNHVLNRYLEMIPSTYALTYARAQRKKFLELKEFIRFASVSAQPRHADDTAKCAEWLADHLGGVGLEQVQVIPTARQPIVYGDWRRAPPGTPTVLIYGHYDVQPAEPLEEWSSPPFEAFVRGHDIYGRGADDNKGQMLAHVNAIESFVNTVGALPVNVVCLFEGEEEIGSPNLASFMVANRSALAADCAVVSDTQIPAPNRPAITYALWNVRERTYMREVGPSDATVPRAAGATEAWGEADYSLYERTTIRPALTVSGIVGGYQGPGVKAAIPAGAVAKLNFRLAPDQDPHKIDQLFRGFIAKITPLDVNTRVRTLVCNEPALIDRDHPFLTAAARAYHRAFGAPAVFLRSGGTIPIVSLVQKVLEVPVVLMGFGLPDDRIHAPNEQFHLPNFHAGIETSIHFLAEMGAHRAASHEPISSYKGSGGPWATPHEERIA